MSVTLRRQPNSTPTPTPGPSPLTQPVHHGITPDTRLYRWVQPERLGARGKIEGNPRSIAEIEDPYRVERNPMYDALLDQTPATPELLAQHGIQPTRASRRTANELGPSLNVSLGRSATYGGEGRRLISVRAGDVIESGGRFYEDVGAADSSIRPLIVTVPKSVPYRRER